MFGGKAKRWLMVGALMLGAMKSAYAVPVLSLTTPSPVVPGQSVVADVTISGAVDLFAYQFSLLFNPSALRATSVTEGPFLATGGSTFFDGGTIDNATGTVSFILGTLLGAINGVNGSGVLAHVTFNVLQAGSTPITFNDVLVLDALGNVVPTLAPGVVVQIPEPGILLLLAMALATMALVARARARKL